MPRLETGHTENSKLVLLCHEWCKAVEGKIYEDGQVQCNSIKRPFCFAAQTKTSLHAQAHGDIDDTLHNAREHPHMSGSKPACEP
jgi:hypothetical protein